MTAAPPVPEDPGGERDATRLEAMVADTLRHREALFGSALAVEFGRVRGVFDAREAARYAAQVVDNSRALAAGNPRTHMSLLRGQLQWLRGLKPGELWW